MSKPMFELIAGGMGRSVPPAVLPVLARHVDWLAGAGVDLAAMAAGMEGRYKLEEHKQVRRAVGEAVGEAVGGGGC